MYRMDGKFTCREAIPGMRQPCQDVSLHEEVHALFIIGIREARCPGTVNMINQESQKSGSLVLLLSSPRPQFYTTDHTGLDLVFPLHWVALVINDWLLPIQRPRKPGKLSWSVVRFLPAENRWARNWPQVMSVSEEEILEKAGPFEAYVSSVQSRSGAQLIVKS